MKNEVEISELPTSEKPNKRLRLERKRLEKLREEGTFTKKSKLEETKAELARALHEADTKKRQRAERARDYVIMVKCNEIKPLDAFLGGEKNDNENSG